MTTDNADPYDEMYRGAGPTPPAIGDEVGPADGDQPVDGQPATDRVSPYKGRAGTPRAVVTDWLDADQPKGKKHKGDVAAASKPEAGTRKASTGKPSMRDDYREAIGSGLQRLRNGLKALSGRGRTDSDGASAPSASASKVTTDGHVEQGHSSPEEMEWRLKLSLREASLDETARFCVGSPKGGVGKSSLAYAFAGALARYTNLRVCLVDADPNFGSMRLLVPRPVERSVLDLAEDADELNGLTRIRHYVAKNEKMGLDVVLGPSQAHELAEIEDLGEAYARVDSVLSEFYDIVVYDLGPGFRDPAIREVLSFSDELLYVTDAEKISNAMLSGAVKYVESLNVGLSRKTITLTIQHRLGATDESAKEHSIREAHASVIGRITKTPYDARMSKLLNSRSFDVEELDRMTRLSILTTAAACLKGLEENRQVLAQQQEMVVADGRPTDDGRAHDRRY